MGGGNKRGKQEEIAGVDMDYLARHGLNVDVKRVTGGCVNVADELLMHATDAGADFIVMGGGLRPFPPARVRGRRGDASPLRSFMTEPC